MTVFNLIQSVQISYSIHKTLEAQETMVNISTVICYTMTHFFLMIFSDAVITVKLGLKIIVNELGEGDLELFQNTPSTVTLSNKQQTY